jgi:hypothetical protein
VPPQPPHPLLPIPSNLAEELLQLTSSYSRSKADHENHRDEWHEAIYTAAAEYRATFRQIARWTGVTEARIGTIVARMTAIHQRRAIQQAPAPLHQVGRPAA